MCVYAQCTCQSCFEYDPTKLDQPDHIFWQVGIGWEGEEGAPLLKPTYVTSGSPELRPGATLHAISIHSNVLTQADLSTNHTSLFGEELIRYHMI